MRFRPLLDPNVDRQDARCKFKACSITRNGDKLVAGTEDGRVVMYTLAQVSGWGVRIVNFDTAATSVDFLLTSHYS